MIKINKKTLVQYVLIFLMMISQGSHLYSLYKNYMPLLILGVCSLLLIKDTHLITRDIIFLCAVLFFTVCFVRLINHGGVGVTVLFEYTSKLLIMYMAYSYDKERFPLRFVRVVYFYAVTSLIFYSISQVSPDAVKALTPFHIYSRYYKTEFHGLLLYVLREAEVERNTGIFMEPGLYQIALCTGLYLLLFYQQAVGLEQRKRIRYIFILMLTLITTKSTSGYLGLLLLISVYIMSKKDRMKGKILKLIGLSMFILGINYVISPSSSIIKEHFIDKVVDESKRVTLNASSGMYRMQAVETCKETIGEYPLGIGYDRTHERLLSKYPGASGAALAIDIMALGILPILVIVGEFLRQSIRNRSSVINVIIFIFFYLNTSLAQSSIFYPTLVIIAYLEYGNYRGEQGLKGAISTAQAQKGVQDGVSIGKKDLPEAPQII